MRYDDIKPYIEKKLVSEQAHPEDPDVRIFNYTQHCQFERAWDDITRQCRGLIMNVRTGEVIAKPFPKFFNYGEHVEKGWAIPTTKPEVFEKLDGSLGILYELKGQMWIATRGSFTSDQAQWATQWWRMHFGDVLYTNHLTHLFEIIYPENRIVVNYDYSGLVHLASLYRTDGRVCDLDPLLMFGKALRAAKRIPYTDMESLQKLDDPNSEGFVLFYPEENVRMKIKFPEYVRLHKLITGVSEIAIWEHLSGGQSLEHLIEKVPDEFYQWVAQVSNRLNDKFNAIREGAETDFNAILAKMKTIADLPAQGAEHRKAFATLATQHRNPQLLFALLDDKPINRIIWRMIRPHGRSSYKVDIDA